jgi:hypothetical protein
MTSRNFLLGGIVASIVYFLLGWLTYGMLLRDFMQANAGSATGVDRNEADFVWWSLVLGHVAWGFLISYVMNKAGATSAASGATIGIVVGLLMCAGFDLVMYAVSNLIGNLSFIAVDVAASAIISGIAGGITAMVLSMSKKSVAAA